MKRHDFTRHADPQAEGNQNMLRIWGGGIYEPDALYE